MNEYEFTSTIKLNAANEDLAYIKLKELWKQLTAKQVFESFKLTKTVEFKQSEFDDDYEDELPY